MVVTRTLEELYGITGETECCANCRHFYRHYVHEPEQYCFVPIGHGHCAYPRLKSRKIDDVCDKFEKKYP